MSKGWNKITFPRELRPLDKTLYAERERSIQISPEGKCFTYETWIPGAP